MFVLALIVATSWWYGQRDRDPAAVEGADVTVPDVEASVRVPPPDETAAAGVARPEERWSVELAAPASAVTIAPDVVVVATEGRLRGIGLENGELAWETESDEHAVQELFAVGDLVIAVLGAGGVRAIDAADGAQRWHSTRSADAAVVTGSVLVVSDGSHVRAIEVGKGRTRWVRTEHATVASGHARDVVLIARPGALLGVDAASGATRWRMEASEAGRPDQSPDAGVVLLADRVVLLDTVAGGVRGSLDPQEALGERVRGRPRIAGEAGVVLSLGEELVAFDDELEALWRLPTGAHTALVGHPQPALAVVGGITVRGLDPATGVDVLQVTPSAWFTALDLRGQVLALAVHTPSRGRLLVADLESPG